MAGYLYSDWIQAVGILLQYDGTITAISAPTVSPSTNAAFNLGYPRAIEYAEQRIYREVDLLLTRVKDSTGTLSANNRSFTLPATGGTIYEVLEQISVLVSGVRQAPLLPMSKEALEAMWPSDTAPSTPSVPTFWCPVDQTSVLVAPPPDTTYSVECFGTKRPAPLAFNNTSTFLTQYLPDLFLAGTMVWWTGYQRDFGAQSEDPKMAQSWESQFQSLLKGADVEEARKKFQAAGWSARQPTPIATPPQT